MGYVIGVDPVGKRQPAMNNQRFEHRGRNGCKFFSEKCDLSTGIMVYVPPGASSTEIAADAAQMAGYHAANILPKLNWFPGYDTLKFTFYENA